MGGWQLWLRGGSVVLARCAGRPPAAQALPFTASAQTLHTAAPAPACCQAFNLTASVFTRAGSGSQRRAAPPAEGLDSLADAYGGMASHFMTKPRRAHSAQGGW